MHMQILVLQINKFSINRYLLKIMLILLIIILIIIIIISQLIKIIKVEKFEDITQTKINPIIELAKETTKLEITKTENKQITDLTEKLKLVRNELESRIDELTRTINEKKQDKLNVEAEIDEINKKKINALAVFQVLKDKIDDTSMKELELAKKEKDLEDKEKEMIKISDIKENELSKTILSKLEEILKNINDSKIDEFCVNTKVMPKPIFKTYNETINDYDLTNKWCSCNDNNKTDACVNYLTCKTNYDNNKDKNNLSGDELDVYFKCIDLYTDFPKYLIKN